MREGIRREWLRGGAERAGEGEMMGLDVWDLTVLLCVFLVGYAVGFCKSKCAIVSHNSRVQVRL